MQIDLKTLAERVGGRLDGPADLMIQGLAGIRDAQAGECTFVSHPRYLADMAATRASAVICGESVECALPAIRATDPAIAFGRALHVFAPHRSELFPAGVDPRAAISPDAILGENVHVGPFALIGPGCRVGASSVIAAHCVLLHSVELGSEVLLYPHVIVRENCRLGDRVIVHSGAVIGSDGFGYARDADSVHKIPQIGQVLLESDVEIGANVCIDRATTGVTRIGAFTKIDNLVQIAHNVRIGQRTAISAQCGIAGSTTVGDDVILGGQVGLADHVQIGDRVRIGAKSGVSHHLGDDETVSGIPARDHREWRRQLVHASRLGRYAEEIATLRQRVQELEND